MEVDNSLNKNNNLSVLSSCTDIIDSKLKETALFCKSPKFVNKINPNTSIHQRLNEYKPTENIYKDETKDSVGIVSDLKGKVHKGKIVGLSFLPEQRERLSRKKGGLLSLMVMGPAGSGKTTFVNTLFGSDVVDCQVEKEVHSGSKVVTHKFEVTEDGFPLRVNIIHTPGFGQLVDNQFAWAPASKYIDDQFKMHLFQEEQPVRKNKLDSRIHCCLYFITPNGKGLSQLDISSMKELSKRVNLIPVIAKSDTFNSEDLTRFKKIVRDTLALNCISVCDLVLDHLLKDQISENMPFAVIGSNEFHEDSQGKLVRGRKYQWGLAEVENPSHCDFLLLREIIMGNNMLDLILSTETHYEKFRSLYLNDKFKEAIKGKSFSDAQISRMDGLEQLVYFHKTLLASFNDNPQGDDPILLNKQLQMKEKFAGIISNQEKRFKDWKKALSAKQNVFNNEIECLRSKIMKLQDIIGHLESGYIISNESDIESTESINEIPTEPKESYRKA